MDSDSNPIAELCAKIDLTIGGVGELTRELRKPRKPRIPAQPVFGRVRASGIFPASGPLVLTFDQPGPEQGYFWYVRSITIGGTDPSASAAGTADVYVSAMLPNATITLPAMGLADWRDHAAALPSVAFYSRGTLPLRLNENLSIFVSGGTQGHQYIAVCQFEQYEEGAVKESWSV